MGGTVIDIPFFQPPTAPGRARKYGMLLVRLDASLERSMSTAPLSSFVDEYIGAQDDLSNEDIALRAALRIPRVRLIPLRDYVEVRTP